MSNVLPIVLWYGGLLGIALAALLVLWAIAVYAFKPGTGPFAAGIVAGVVLAASSCWALTSAIGLSQGNQLLKVREPLVRLVAGSVLTRAALEDVRAVAEPSPDLTSLQGSYDSHEVSIGNLLQAEWQYHRGGPWDERALLYKMTWDLHDVVVHHARWEKRAEALECPETPGVPSLSDASAQLRDRLQNQQLMAGALGEQFEGYDLNEGDSGWSDATTARALAGVLGALSLLALVAVVIVRRKRPSQMSDALVIAAALVLVPLAGWLALGTGAEQERLRANLFEKTAIVYRESVDLNASAKALMPSPRSGLLPPRDSAGKIIADYAEYTNSLNGLAELVRIWDRAVLTGTLDTGLVSSDRIQTHDDLLNAVHSRTWGLYRGYVQLDQRIANSSCRSQWFVSDGNRAREEALVSLP